MKKYIAIADDFDVRVEYKPGYVVKTAKFGKMTAYTTKSMSIHNVYKIPKYILKELTHKDPESLLKLFGTHIVIIFKVLKSRVIE